MAFLLKFTQQTGAYLLRNLSLLWLIGGMSPLASADFADPIDLRSVYDQTFQRELGSQLPLVSDFNRIEQFKNFLSLPTLSETHRYLAQRALLSLLENSGLIAEHQALCLKMKPRQDDFVIRADCLARDLKIPLQKRKDQLLELFGESTRAQQGTTVPSRVALDLLYLAASSNDVSTVRLIYQKALELTPPEARASLFNLKWAVATLYSNTMNSHKTQQEGLKIWDDLETVARQEPSLALAIPSILISRGEVYIKQDDLQAKALQIFARMPKESSYWIDASIYSAVAWMQLGQANNAWNALKAVDVDKHPDPERRPIMKCYEVIVKKFLGRTDDVAPCFQLPEEIQADTFLHITQLLADSRLSEGSENKFWKQFWKFFMNHLKPELQDSSDLAVNALELERARSEAQIKDLQLKNFGILKYFFALLSMSFVSVLLMLWRLRLKNQKILNLQKYIQESVLSRFLPPLIVKEILAGKSRIESHPKDECVTILFCDMIGFTALAGKLGAEQSSQILNRFMQVMTEVIYLHGGTIDKFIGDAVMVIFGAPSPLTETEQIQGSAACARAMIAAMEGLNHDLERLFRTTIKVRIGINHGSAIVGTFGSEKRSDYTAIGPTVNLASRIEGQAGPNEILLSPSMAAHLEAEQLEDRGLYRLRGIDADIRLYALKLQESPSVQMAQ